MTKTVVIHQPDFAPWLGFFHRFLEADLWIVLDHVDYAPRNWTHRDRIKTAQGPLWLSLSVVKAPRGTPIFDIQLSDDVDWRGRHLNLIREAYRAAPYFAEVYPDLEALYAGASGAMAGFNLAVIDWAAGKLDARIPRRPSSSMVSRQAKSALMAALVEEAGGAAYLTGTGARDYLDEAPFRARGIKVVWQKFESPVYPQLHGRFEPYLSIIDAFMNVGYKAAPALLRRMTA
jgi:hypothetical protein